MLDTYRGMRAESRRVMHGRQRGFDRYDYLLTLDELQQIADARVHPSNRRSGERRAQRSATSRVMRSGALCMRLRSLPQMSALLRTALVHLHTLHGGSRRKLLDL